MKFESRLDNTSVGSHSNSTTPVLPRESIPNTPARAGRDLTSSSEEGDTLMVIGFTFDSRIWAR